VILDLGKNRSNTKDNSRSASILVVDDEQDIVNLIKQSLEVDGFHVCIFTDAFAALKHFKSNSKAYRIIISDIRMPGMNGYEFVKQAKKINPQIKIMLMSAFEIVNTEFSNVMPDVKIDAFIQKPFSLDTLRNTIHEKYQRKK
jgi:DNA-binding NtrC family response regulator